MASMLPKKWILATLGSVIVAAAGAVVTGLFGLLKPESRWIQVGHLGDNNVSFRGGDTYYAPPTPSPGPKASAAPLPPQATAPAPSPSGPGPTPHAPAAPNRTDLGAPSGPAQGKPPKATPVGKDERRVPRSETRAGDRDRVLAITIDGTKSVPKGRVFNEDIADGTRSGDSVNNESVTLAGAATLAGTLTVTRSPWSIEGQGCGSMDGTEYLDPPGPHAALTCHARSGAEVVEILCPACDVSGACPPCAEVSRTRAGQ